ncbi:aldehyde dehydrogenase family protein [uncultured Sphingomonas sp.]|uniref:aldehyde dehydrogenase family protein n=1 Tax=uncultured Sphingomonas sp. TaxID=158754 RepID=UPI0035CA4B6A
MTNGTIDDVYHRVSKDPASWLAGLTLTMTIDGADVAGAPRGIVIDPCSETPIADYPDATVAHVDLAVRAARRAFADWSARSWEARRAALNRFADLLAAHHDELAAIVACESGRPLRRAWAECRFAVDYVRTIAAASVSDRRFDRPGLSVGLTHRSLGVVAAIAPWNGPVILAVAKIANALLAGDTLVLRPSPFTPLSALYMGRLGREAFPPGVFNVITGDASVGAAMTMHADVAKISFTGSTETGKRIAIAAAPTLKRLTLELGGNDAAIVLPDADVAAVAGTIFEISLGNAGHFCAAVKRLYVHEDIYGAVRDALAAKAHAAVLGANFDSATTMGPVQNRPQFDRIWALFDDAVANGARIVAGGVRGDRPGLFIPPTLVDGIGHGVALVDEEQFGPVLPLISFRNAEDAVRMANDSPYGLGGSIWTADIVAGIALAARLEVGTAWVNQHGAFTAALPMPFAKQSGIGIDYAEYGVGEHMRPMLINAKVS